jgi:hypothetical protein
MTDEAPDISMLCLVCGAKCENEKCKVICRSEICVYRVVMNCSEFDG